MTTAVTPSPKLHLAGTLSGAPLSLPSASRGPALLLFWNIGCAGCTGRALPLAKALAEQYPALQVVAVHSVFAAGAPQPVGQLRAVAAHFALPFPVALDEGAASYHAFGAEGTPHWVLLDEGGGVRKSFFGSMEGAQQRLRYALAELFGEAGAARRG